MKFYRPRIEVEGMAMENTQGEVYGYLLKYPGEIGTRELSLKEFQAEGFLMMNGHDPTKPRTPRKKRTNYHSSAEAPDLSGEERAGEEEQGPPCLITGNSVAPGEGESPRKVVDL